MLNSEWDDIFNIDDELDTDALQTGPCPENEKQKKMDATSALISSLNNTGRVDIAMMEDLSGLNYDELTRRLKGAIYQDPAQFDESGDPYAGWMLSAKYLSGNIKDKLDIAKSINKKYNGRFISNINALKRMLPDKVSIDDIGFNIGSPWIPENLYTNFAVEVLQLKEKPEIIYSPYVKRWKVSISKSGANSIKNTMTYGTSKITALQILEKTLNGDVVKVYKPIPVSNQRYKGERVLDRSATLEAQEKQQLLMKAFEEWVKKDKNLVNRLENIFYNAYACNFGERYSGSFLELPGLNTGAFTPYPYQKDAVARMIFDDDVLLTHAVGSGKTAIIIMGIHERKRLGLSERNMVVVPNNVLDMFEEMHRKLYPNDKILVIHTKDFSPSQRNETLSKVIKQDFTAIYIAFSSFERLDMSSKYKLKKQEELIQGIKAKKALAPEKWEKDRLETKIKNETKTLEEIRNDLPSIDEYLSFDELGITTLVVDEAHNFKNISIGSRSDGVVGMHSSGSKKCDDMLEKVQYVRENGIGVIFSTGTPLTNSISDLFVMQTYLQPEQLELLDINKFDSWINNFASRKTSFEIDVDSQNFRIRTRYSSFHNLPELLNLAANVMDFHQADDRLSSLPECDGYTDIVVPRSKEQMDYCEDLAIRTEMIHQRLVTPAEDNLLKVTSDGREAALDIKLVEEYSLRDRTHTKTYACAKEILKLYHDYPGTAQLVFCDLGTPKKGFNIYDELKSILVSSGIPEDEIAYVHDAVSDKKRNELFKKVNEAKIRVLIGSTQKLGMGVNVQTKLIAIHHLDIPWKPSDIMQREGRLIRQGNTNEEVYRFRYVTAGTFDAYSWQLLENKQRFISQFMNNDISVRDCRDIDDVVLSYAEIKALAVGDPLLKTRIETSNSLEKQRTLKRHRDNELHDLDTFIKGTPQKIEALKKTGESLKVDYELFQVEKRHLSKDRRKEIGNIILDALSDYGPGIYNTNSLLIVHGFHIIIPSDYSPERPEIKLTGRSGLTYSVDMRGARESGCIQRIENTLSRLKEDRTKILARIESLKREMDNAMKEFIKGNQYDMPVKELSIKLIDIDEELTKRAEEAA